MWPDPATNPVYTDPPIDLFLGVEAELDEAIISDFNAPQWKYFWEFGDGIYNKDSSGIHKFSSEGIFVVSAKATPIYSGNEEPDIEKISIHIPDPPAQVPDNSNFDSLDNVNSNILKLEPHWSGLEPGDTMTLAVSYRRLTESMPDHGNIIISFPNGDILLDQVRMENLPKVEENDSGELTEWRWNFKGLELLEERTFFIDAVLDSLVGQGETTSALSLDISMILPFEKDFSNLLNLPGTGLNSGSADASIPNEEASFVSSSSDFSVNRARDPNTMVSNPRTIAPGKQSTKLSYTITFRNNAPLALARYIELKTSLSDEIDPTGMPTNGEDYEYSPKNPQLLSLDVGKVGSLRPSWVLNPKPSIRGVLGPGQTGYLRFEVSALSSYDFSTEDTIKAFTDIVFGGEGNIITPIAYTRVVEPLKLKLPWFLGVKIGANGGSSPSPGILNGGGYHFGLTARKALKALAPSYRNQRRIPISALPRFWYQLELMGSNLVLNDLAGNEYQYWRIELVPLQIRYLPNFGMIKKGMLAISGGGLLGYNINTKVNNTRRSLSSNEKIELIAFADVAILNIVGTPGISLAYRLNWRITSGIEDQNDQYNQLFIHYNF